MYTHWYLVPHLVGITSGKLICKQSRNLIPLRRRIQQCPLLRKQPERNYMNQRIRSRLLSIQGWDSSSIFPVDFVQVLLFKGLPQNMTLFLLYPCPLAKGSWHTKFGVVCVTLSNMLLLWGKPSISWNASYTLCGSLCIHGISITVHFLLMRSDPLLGYMLYCQEICGLILVSWWNFGVSLGPSMAVCMTFVRVNPRGLWHWNLASGKDHVGGKLCSGFNSAR
jgi:hypothetical protein